MMIQDEVLTYALCSFSLLSLRPNNPCFFLDSGSDLLQKANGYMMMIQYVRKACKKPPSCMGIEKHTCTDRLTA